MALEPDARRTIGHLHQAALHQRKAAGIVLTEEQQAALREHRAQVLQDAQRRGERV